VKPRDGPPCVITSFQALLGSGVVWSHFVKSGKVRGGSNPLTAFGVPLPSAPWQAAHADLKVCLPASASALDVFLSFWPHTSATGTHNHNATSLATAFMQRFVVNEVIQSIRQ
jgi:hypothetical protein